MSKLLTAIKEIVIKLFALAGVGAIAIIAVAVAVVVATAVIGRQFCKKVEKILTKGYEEEQERVFNEIMELADNRINQISDLYEKLIRDAYCDK